VTDVERSQAAISRYHEVFAGDTFGACARCGGRCEKFKVAALLPGEKEWLADRLGIPLAELQRDYLDQILAGDLVVDVIKLVDGCPFLDAEYRCTIRAVKPVLCDCYPLVFRVEGHGVVFELDTPDQCPLVGYPDLRDLVAEHRRRGTEALQGLAVPLAWWRAVEILDGPDYDYPGFERELRQGPGCETYWLEQVLGFACNGFEEQARRAGLRLLRARLRRARRALRSLDRLVRRGGVAGALSRVQRGRQRARLARLGRWGAFLAALPDLAAPQVGRWYRELVAQARALLGDDHRC
jgi:Fe-S-cluster containining protein